MIGTIRKHSKALWLIIIVVIIFTFVIWGSRTSQFDSAGAGNLGTINGQPITKDDFMAAAAEAKLRYFFARGEWPDRGFDVERETYFQLLLIQKQQDFGIHVSPDAIATFASARMRALNQGNPVPLDVFVKQVLKPRGATAADFERYIRHELGLQQLITMASMSGSFTSAEEVRSLYARENEEFSVQAVFFQATNYLGEVAGTPAAIAEFYTNHMAEYRLPDRVRVSYVKFSASNHVAEATKFFNELTNLNEIVEAQLQQLGTNFFSEAKTPEEAKEKTREWMFKRRILNQAYKQAGEFATLLDELKPVAPDNLEALARTNGLTVEVTEPFDREHPPKALKVAPEFARIAFGMNAAEPFAGPIIGEEAVYVIAPKQSLPSENPPFETVREKATQDYKFRQAMTLALNAGNAFHQSLTNSLATGKTFMAVAAEAKLKPVLPPAFSISTRRLPEVESLVSLPMFKQVVFTTPPGKPSAFTATRDGGFIVFVAAKLPLDEARMRKELAEFTQNVRQNRQSEAFNYWFQQEAGRGLRDVPFFKEKQRPSGSGEGE